MGGDACKLITTVSKRHHEAALRICQDLPAADRRRIVLAPLRTADMVVLHWLGGRLTVKVFYEGEEVVVEFNGDAGTMSLFAVVVARKL